MSVVQAPSSEASALSEVDRLFATLDGVQISNGRSEWSSRIQGIYADGPYVWVQLSRDEEDAESVVLRLPRPTILPISSARSTRFALTQTHRRLSGSSLMTKTLAILALAGMAGTGVASAGSSSAQMTVGVTVVRSCAVDARPDKTGADPASDVHERRAVHAQSLGDGATAVRCRPLRRQHSPHAEFLAKTRSDAIAVRS